MKSSMRCVIVSLAVLGLAPQAAAADLGYLRGSEVYGPGPASYYNWSGFYLGGQAGYGNAQMDFSRSASSLVAFILRESTLESGGQISQWEVLGTADSRGVNYGGFIGYNAQFENVVLGLEANYNRTDYTGASAGSLRRVVSPGDGLTYATQIDASASMHITDYGTLRARAGYVMGRFLPYVMAGLAMGRVENLRSVTVSADIRDPSDPTYFVAFRPPTETETKATYAIGYSLGAGLDVALMDYLFVRGEVEWVQFTNLPDMEANIVTGRVAAGVKF